MRGLVSSLIQWLRNFISSFLTRTVDAGEGSVDSFNAGIGCEASAGSLCAAADDCISAGSLGVAEPPQTGSTPKTPEEKKVSDLAKKATPKTPEEKKAKKARRKAKKAHRQTKKDDDYVPLNEDEAILKWKELIVKEESKFGLAIIDRVNDWEILREFKKQRPLECERPPVELSSYENQPDYLARAALNYQLTKTELKLIGDLYISLFYCSARDEVYQEIGQKIWNRKFY